MSKEWVDTVADSSRLVQAKLVSLAGDEIYLGEWKLFGLKKWILYGEVETKIESKLKALLALAKNEQVFLIESCFNMSRWQCPDLLESYGRITMPFGTYLVDLTLSQDDLWGKVHSKHRNVIRRAIKENVEVRFDLNITTFKALLDQTYAKGGRKNPFSLTYLNALKNNLKENLLIAGAYHKDILQAGLIVPFDRSTGYYLHGATRLNGVLGASNLLHWEIIRELKSRGVKKYDLGGARRQTDDSRLKGIFKFKERFGGDFIDCYYWEKVINQKTFAVYTTFKKSGRTLKNVLTGHS